MCPAFHDRYGLNYAGLRYECIWTASDQTFLGVIPIMLNKMIRAPINGDGTQAYDFIYVEDVARANVLALQSSATAIL